ncbi:MAG: hypothetical protein ACRDRH_19285 [Pseudonocardia sp.]
MNSARDQPPLRPSAPCVLQALVDSARRRHRARRAARVDITWRDELAYWQAMRRGKRTMR